MDKTLSRIIIVDDHPITRKALKLIVSEDERLLFTGEASNVPEALELIELNRPDLAIIDITLGSSQSGIELIKTIREKYGDEISVLVITMHDENCFAERILRSGAQGYIMKSEPVDEILNAIQTILRGEIYLSQNMCGKILKNYCGSFFKDLASIHRLTDDELELLSLIGKGYRFTVIAKLLGMKRNTLYSRCRKIREKLDISDPDDLIIFAVNWEKHIR